jgi:manganese transport protein
MTKGMDFFTSNPPSYIMSYHSLDEVHGSIDTRSEKSGWKRFFMTLGPAFLVCVGYMDPGNWATDIAGGSKYGYSLLWVLVMSNGIALLLQTLSARLGIVRERDLAQASREAYPKIINIPLFILAQIAIAACDLAEVIGMAIGLNLLFGLPLIWGISVALLDTFIILYLQNKGMRYIELFILSLVCIIGMCFAVELFFAQPNWSELHTGFFPSIPDKGALYIAIGIIGATVMPHNLYLHSALVQTRKHQNTPEGIKEALKYNFIDSALALNLALFVNAAILIVAAAVFHKHGMSEITELQDAHRLLAPLLGEKLAPTLFAVALIASGQSSTITGTLAGQIIMEGYLDLRIAAWLRRLITRLLAVIPAFLTILWMGEEKVGDLLILSQVILSLQLGFAVIPLIHFTSDKAKMGEFAIALWVKILAWLSAIIIVGLNIQLVIKTVLDWKNEMPNSSFLFYGLISPILLGALGLLGAIIVYPYLTKREIPIKTPHGRAISLDNMQTTVFSRIIICVDFSKMDFKAIEAAINQGKNDTTYYLVHVVESASAKYWKHIAQDFETNEDVIQLNDYVMQLQQKGYQVVPEIGFGSPRQAIPKIANTVRADLIVMGSHGHKGLFDWVFGETIVHVRHAVTMPVLAVK